jgi:hypothetical protein
MVHIKEFGNQVGNQLRVPEQSNYYFHKYDMALNADTYFGMFLSICSQFECLLICLEVALFFFNNKGHLLPLLGVSSHLVLLSPRGSYL